MPPLISSLTAAAVLGVGALQVMDGTLTIGTLVAFQSLLMSFSAPDRPARRHGEQDPAGLGRPRAPRGRHALWPRLALPGDAAGADRGPSAAGHLTLKDVSFGYSPLEPPLIENFSLDVAPGHWVALVGGSGSGKTTIGKLITGLYEPRVRRDPHRRPHAQEWGRHAVSRMS